MRACQGLALIARIVEESSGMSIADPRLAVVDLSSFYPRPLVRIVTKKGRSFKEVGSFERSLDSKPEKPWVKLEVLSAVSWVKVFGLSDAAVQFLGRTISKLITADS